MYNEIFMVYIYVRCYEGLEMEDEVIKVLILYLFFIRLVSNNEFLKMVERFFK